jgi:hypothetical protein
MVSHKPQNNNEVKQLCIRYAFGNMITEIYGVWNSFEDIRADEYDHFELLIVYPKSVGEFLSIPIEGHIPTKEEALEYVSEHLASA